ncbi:PEGA domain-containing protein [Pseudoflavitalea sp. G-6-1-2]|uniref:PEGA domain-containing protein n=1 Tax=Pseudoflavitalea sp. G-6-1-2 TaxID=2728841 RepID=UPI00146CF39D|nr:PEGA domain-containing protein [Pseudoflavitalea sp. G-6-1-2]NML23839.1 PEGA domain-containing protein [Pseudoflavitalea sp. G-6-1-2]
MKILYSLIAIPVLLASSCKKGDDKKSEPKNTHTISFNTPGNEPGFIYVDGQYTGSKTPASIELQPGNHTIGIALQNSFTYLRKETNVSGNATIDFTNADKPAPKTWKALWIGLYETTGISATGNCSTHFSQSELDAGYDFFNWSLQQHFEKYSYGTMKWEVERKDISVPVSLTRANANWFTVEPSTITALMPQIQPGVYDCVFVFWREKEGSCSFQSNYFGLAWTNPIAEPIKTGYVTVKFDAGTSITDRINYYKTTDPGVYIHEWLHTTGENFYQNKGLALPAKAGGYSVHAAEMYNYSFPWMNWYLDFVSGRVPNPSGEPKYLGIGPDGLLRCTVRETAVNNNCR